MHASPLVQWTSIFTTAGVPKLVLEYMCHYLKVEKIRGCNISSDGVARGGDLQDGKVEGGSRAEDLCHPLHANQSF